jgi:hypothetical protein
MVSTIGRDTCDSTGALESVFDEQQVRYNGAPSYAYTPRRKLKSISRSTLAVNDFLRTEYAPNGQVQSITRV